MENVVKKLVIDKLYDIYDYEIIFEKGEITLLTGPNGYGKTTILNIIKNALTLNFWYFYNLLFSSIQIIWGDGTILNIKKEISIQHKEQQSIFDDAETSEYSDTVEYEVKIVHVDKEGQSLGSTTLNRHRWDSMQERYFHRHIRHEYTIDFNNPSNIETRFPYEDNNFRTSFAVLRLFSLQCNCMYIQAQRIFDDSIKNRHEEIKSNDRYTITKLAENVKAMYREQQRMYVEKSQQIDSTFIQRQIEKKHSTYTLDEYQKKLDDLKLKIANFEKYGLIDKYNLVEDYNDSLRTVLSMHIDDMNEKFSVYDKFYDKLERFDKSVSGKGLANKKMVLDSEKGITFISKSGRVIPLHKLSSGEQNLVILYYRLIFETNNETLLLIDEPENSIHIEWLKEMLNDYIVTAEILKCQMLIATHSIPFIDGHWNITYDLFNKSFLD